MPGSLPELSAPECFKVLHFEVLHNAWGAKPNGYHGPEHRYISRRPSMALSMVTSSVYSMSLPTGMPMAMRVMRSPCRFNCWAR